jgi:uncharacterized membrane protein YjdF
MKSMPYSALVLELVHVFETSEGHLCDVVWAFQILPIPLVFHVHVVLVLNSEYVKSLSYIEN